MSIFLKTTYLHIQGREVLVYSQLRSIADQYRLNTHRNNYLNSCFINLNNYFLIPTLDL